MITKSLNFTEMLKSNWLFVAFAFVILASAFLRNYQADFLYLDDYTQTNLRSPYDLYQNISKQPLERPVQKVFQLFLYSFGDVFTNVFLFSCTAITALLAARISYILLESPTASFITLILLVIPVYTPEAIFWRAASYQTLSTSIVLMAITLYIRGLQDNQFQLKFFLLSSILFCMAVLAGEQAINWILVYGLLGSIATFRSSSEDRTLIRNHIFLAVLLTVLLFISYRVFYQSSSGINSYRGDVSLAINPIESLTNWKEMIAFHGFWGNTNYTQLITVLARKAFFTNNWLSLVAVIICGLGILAIHYFNVEQVHIRKLELKLIVPVLFLCVTLASLIIPIAFIEGAYVNRTLFYPYVSFAIFIGSVVGILAEASRQRWVHQLILSFVVFWSIFAFFMTMGIIEQFRIRHERDQEYLQYFVEHVPEEELPANTVVLSVGASTELIPDRRFQDDYLIGLFEHSFFTWGGIFKEYPNKSVTGYVYPTPTLPEDYNPAAASVVIRGQVIPASNLLIFQTMDDGTIQFFESMTRVTDNFVIQLPLGQAMVRQGAPSGGTWRWR